MAKNLMHDNDPFAADVCTQGNTEWVSILNLAESFVGTIISENWVPEGISNFEILSVQDSQWQDVLLNTKSWTVAPSSSGMRGTATPLGISVITPLYLSGIPPDANSFEERIELLASLSVCCVTHRPHHREQEDAINPLQFCFLIQGGTCKPQFQVKSDVKHLDRMHLVKQTFMLLHSMSSLDVHMTLVTERYFPL